MTTNLSLDAIRASLEGAIPGIVATCAADGTPNVAYLSQVEYVDATHLALSFQFFNKTRANVLANARVELVVMDPRSAAMTRIQANYLRTETDGPLFERMKAKLAGIASHTGMGGVFRLLGADVYAVSALEQAVPPTQAVAATGLNHLAALRRCSERISACAELDALVDTALDALCSEFGIEHAMLLMLDAAGQRLYTVGSLGYGQSGVGSEIPIGHGVIGVAAQARTPIRINHLTRTYAYPRAIRDVLSARGDFAALEQEIPLPGLADPHSQMALPIRAGDELQGVLFVESAQDMRFAWDDEDALVALAGQLGAALRGLQACADAVDDAALAAGAGTPAEPVSIAAAAPLRVRYFEADSSIFLDDDYLIKGVAGSVLWKLLRDHAREGRTEFSNRELRLSPEIRLPDVSDNLEARLLLLGRRLVERQASVRIEKTGRGRFRLCVARPVQLNAA